MSLTKKLIILGVVLVIVGSFLWFSIIPSYFHNSSNSSYNAPYTSLTLRDGMNNSAILDFGDTEYTFEYSAFSGLTVSTFIYPYEMYSPHIGDMYRFCGIEIDMSNVTSDYISNYIVFSVKPTVQNYMASLHYTKVNMTLYQPIEVNISSGLINKTNTYWFNYYKVEYPTYDGLLEIQNASESKDYEVHAGGTLTASASDFNIETRVFKVESEYMVIYVKPLY